MNVRRWNQRCNSKLAKLIILRILLFISSLATTSNASKEKKRIEWKEKQTKFGTHTENNKHISRNEWKKTECRKKLQAKWHSTSRNVLQNFDNGTKFFGSTKLSTWWNFSRFVISHFTGSFFNVRQPQFVCATLSVCVGTGNRIKSCHLPNRLPLFVRSGIYCVSTVGIKIREKCPL